MQQMIRSGEGSLFNPIRKQLLDPVMEVEVQYSLATSFGQKAAVIHAFQELLQTQSHPLVVATIMFRACEIFRLADNTLRTRLLIFFQQVPDRVFQKFSEAPPLTFSGNLHSATYPSSTPLDPNSQYVIFSSTFSNHI